MASSGIRIKLEREEPGNLYNYEIILIHFGGYIYRPVRKDCKSKTSRRISQPYILKIDIIMFFSRKIIINFLLMGNTVIYELFILCNTKS